MIYTKEEKLRVVKLYLNGVIEYPPNATHHQRDNIRKRIKEWVGLYKAHGEEGLEPKNHEYSFETKKKAVQMILDAYTRNTILRARLLDLGSCSITYRLCGSKQLTQPLCFSAFRYKISGNSTFPSSRKTGNGCLPKSMKSPHLPMSRHIHFENSQTEGVWKVPCPA